MKGNHKAWFPPDRDALMGIAAFNVDVNDNGKLAHDDRS